MDLNEKRSKFTLTDGADSPWLRTEPEQPDVGTQVASSSAAAAAADGGGLAAAEAEGIAAQPVGTDNGHKDI